MYEIEKGIPIPNSIHGGGQPPKYPFEQMEIGDSFFIPCHIKDKKTVQSNVASARKVAPKMKFTTKYVDEIPGQTGIRVWRIA